MTWPSSDVDTSAMDSNSDTPPRAEFLSWAQKFNQLRNHVSAYMQGVLTSADAAAARTALGAFSSTMTSGRLLGRVTAGAGAPEELTASQAATLLPASTTSAAGLVELATDAEAQAGTDSSRAVTPDNLGATVIGIGQSWQSVLASRATGTNYANNTGRPIAVLVVATSSAGVGCDFTVGGSIVSRFNHPTVALNGTHSVIVPNGAVYRVNNGTLFSWMELR